MAYKPPMHGRDHCPTGSDPIPADCFASASAPDRAYMLKNTTQTITTATTTNLTSYANGSSVDGTNITTDETTGKFTVTATGIYLLQLVVIWTTAFAAGKMARIQATGEILQDTAYWTNWVTEDDAGLSVDQVVCDALAFITSVSVAPTFQGVVRQLSGSNKDVSGVDFSIVRVGAYTP